MPLPMTKKSNDLVECFSTSSSWMLLLLRIPSSLLGLSVRDAAAAKRRQCTCRTGCKRENERLLVTPRPRWCSGRAAPCGWRTRARVALGIRQEVASCYDALLGDAAESARRVLFVVHPRGFVRLAGHGELRMPCVGVTNRVCVGLSYGHCWLTHSDVYEVMADCNGDTNSNDIKKVGCSPRNQPRVHQGGAGCPLGRCRLLRKGILPKALHVCRQDTIHDGRQRLVRYIVTSTDNSVPRTLANTSSGSGISYETVSLMPVRVGLFL